MFRFLLLALLAAEVWAATDVLVSNYAFSAVHGSSKGELWVFSRGDTGGGFADLKLSLGSSGVTVSSSESSILENDVDYTAVHDGILSDVQAERLRTPMIEAGKLGVVVPMFGEDSTGSYRKPAGIISMRGTSAGGLTYITFDSPGFAYKDTVPQNMDAMASGFAYDSTANVLWVARGTDGLLKYDVSGGLGAAKAGIYALNSGTGKLDSLSSGASISFSTYPAVFGVARDPETGCLLLATADGLWEESSEGAMKFAKNSKVGSARVTGVWVGGSPKQVIAETSSWSKSTLTNKLWRSYDGGSMAEVVFRDTTGDTVSNAYDRADYSVNSVAFVGKVAFPCVRVVSGSETGLLKLDSVGAVPWENDNQWLYGFDAGVVNRNSMILAAADFTMSDGSKGIAVTTYGNGISVSADSGATWTAVLNQASVGKNLSKIRMVPSVIVADGESLVAYNLSKDANITIEVFSYDMRKVRTIVKHAARSASAARSTDPSEDFWDGRDDRGRAVTMGVYYVRVKDNHGHVGWGKVMTLGGAK